MSRLVRIAVGVLFACTVAVVAAGATSEVSVPLDPCVAGSVQTIELPEQTSVNEILVNVKTTTSDDAAADVRVMSGRSERVVKLMGPAPRVLVFEPGLQGSSFDVSIDPVAEAEASVCVDEIILLHDGAVVAKVTP